MSERIHKYRAWDEGNRKMIYNLMLKFKDKGVEVWISDGEEYYYDPGYQKYFLMQFTGLHDKNGVDPTVELYEKDLMKGPGEILIIEQNIDGQWVLKDKNGKLILSLWGALKYTKTYKVGNFYEHPDLLKGEK